MRPRSALLLLVSLLTAGCAASAIPLPATTEILDKVPRVSNSPRSPCWQQREIAAQNTYFETVRRRIESTKTLSGWLSADNSLPEIVYKAPCDVDQKQQVKTS